MITNFQLDPWQKEVLEAEGNICLCSGRQVGKSQIIAIKVAEYIAKHAGKKVLIISITEDQAENMLQKIMIHLYANHEHLIDDSPALKPTKHRVHLTNGSWAVTKAVGQYGLGVLGMTVDVVVPDECAYLPDAIWESITPMLLTTGGSLWLLSTPNAKEGFFYEAYTNPDMKFKTFHVSSEEVAEGRPEPQRTIMLEHLAREKQRMTKLQYAQQYLAKFLEEVGQLFPDKIIKSCQIADRDSQVESGEYYLGVDVARMGGDETTFEVVQKVGDKFIHKENKVSRFTLTTETIQSILDLDNIYKFKFIYIDDGGLGVAVVDQLLINPQTKRKVKAINNSSRAYDADPSRTKKLLKEDLYLNMLNLMEQDKLELLKDPEISASLKSITLENNSSTNQIRIYGRYSHIAEGLIRAVWASRDKKLNLYIERI